MSGCSSGQPLSIASAVAGVCLLAFVGFGCTAATQSRPSLLKREVLLVREGDQSALRVVEAQYLTTVDVAENSDNIANVTRITDNATNGHIGHPRVSPDGSSIAFEYWLKGDSGYNIWSTPSSGGGSMRKITSSQYEDIQPVWTEAAEFIIFSSNRLGPFRLWKARASGLGGVTQLTTGNTSDAAPDISPDGTKLLYTARAGSQPQIWTVNMDGSELTQLREGVDPKWTPDGKQIVFIVASAATMAVETAAPTRSSDRGPYRGVDEIPERKAPKRAVGRRQYSIWIMDVDGGNTTQLLSGNASYRYPDLSPDGKKLVFSSDQSGNSDIWMMDINGSGLMQLTTNAADDLYPVWSPNGRAIYFVSARGERWDIWRITPAL
jgi:TolB protein